jgi:pyruvate/2-oxoacid:ferredoxin oxidoreductase beta subunit
VQTNALTGRGPAWANSLFEDNAQFGLGIAMGLKQRRASYANAVKSLLADKTGPGSAELRNAFEEWLQVCLVWFLPCRWQVTALSKFATSLVCLTATDRGAAPALITN